MTTTELPYQYFVAYSYDGTNLSSMHVSGSRPINDAEAVKMLHAEVTRRLAELTPWLEVDPDQIAVLNWILLSGPDQQRHERLEEFAHWVASLGTGSDPSRTLGFEGGRPVRMHEIADRARQALGEQDEPS